jgi:hypothetical protein
MKFIEIQLMDGNRKLIRSTDVIDVTELEDGNCLVNIQNGVGVIEVKTLSLYRHIHNQLTGYDPHNHGDIEGIRASEIVAIQEGLRGSVDILLRDGQTLNLSSVSLKEMLEMWRA